MGGGGGGGGGGGWLWVLFLLSYIASMLYTWFFMYIHMYRFMDDNNMV